MSLTRSKAILELGSRLASQFDRDADLLSSWMAHYVAQLMSEAADAPPATRTSTEANCAKTIMELWRHRAGLPLRGQPFADMEVIARAIGSLDPNRTDHRYYPDVFGAGVAGNVGKDAKMWLDLAAGIDLSARMLIQSCLRSAATRAASSVAPWVAIAKRAGSEATMEGLIVDFVMSEGSDPRKDTGRNAALKDRLRRLKAFIKLANTVSKDLQDQLHGESTGASKEKAKKKTKRKTPKVAKRKPL